MKRKHIQYISFAAGAMFFVTALNGCGLSPEKISSTLDIMSTEYQDGNYEEAYDCISTIEKSYKKMSDEQKEEYDKIKELIIYAHDNAQIMSVDFSEVKSYIDRNMYYEANVVLTNILNKYTLPPKEQVSYDEYKKLTDAGIKEVEVNNGLSEVSAAFNNDDCDTANEKLTSLMNGELTANQKQECDMWGKKIVELSKLIDAQADFNNKKYSNALGKLDKIDKSFLNTAQQEKCVKLQEKINTAIAEEKRREEEKRRITGDKAIELVKAQRGSDKINKFKFKYKYYDKGNYYLICETATAFADGTNKYRVYKSDSRIEYIGAASDWGSGPSEVQ